jgi:hypothetical protein
MVPKESAGNCLRSLFISIILSHRWITSIRKYEPLTPTMNMEERFTHWHIYKRRKELDRERQLVEFL